MSSPSSKGSFMTNHTLRCMLAHVPDELEVKKLEIVYADGTKLEATSEKSPNDIAKVAKL